MTEYKNILDGITEGRRLPEGTTQWGLKATDYAGRTHSQFRWPDHGWVKAPGPIDLGNTGACPRYNGDGICVGRNFGAIASGGHLAQALMLVAYHEDDVLTPNSNIEGKVRLRSAFVVERLSGEIVVRNHGQGRDFARANLRGMDLSHARLHETKLLYVNLSMASLVSARFTKSNLRSAMFDRAWGPNTDFREADLTAASLSETLLSGADFRNAVLDSTAFNNADLRRADFRDAEFAGTMLDGADLRGANLGGVVDFKAIGLTDAVIDEKTVIDRDALRKARWSIEPGGRIKRALPPSSPRAGSEGTWLAFDPFIYDNAFKATF